MTRAQTGPIGSQRKIPAGGVKGRPRERTHNRVQFFPNVEIAGGVKDRSLSGMCRCDRGGEAPPVVSIQKNLGQIRRPFWTAERRAPAQEATGPHLFGTSGGGPPKALRTKAKRLVARQGGYVDSV